MDLYLSIQTLQIGFSSFD